MEKPRPKADRSGFISRNNPDPTARNTFEVMEAAGVDRERVVLWNVVPAGNGTRKVTGAERRDGIEELKKLLPLLPALRVIVLVGNNAHKARPLVETLSLPVLVSAHPLPLVRNISPALYAEIANIWRRAATVAAESF